MFNTICVKDDYLIKVSFLKYSGLLDYLVYCFPPECIGWKSADFQFFADTGCHVISVTDPYGRILGFLDRSRYFSIK
jgi:hypothetical protein